MRATINRIEVQSWNLSAHGLAIEYKYDGKANHLNADPETAANLFQINGFILLKSIYDGVLVVRYTKDDETTEVVEWSEFVQSFQLSQYMALRIVETHIWNQKGKKMQSNVRGIQTVTDLLTAKQVAL